MTADSAQAWYVYSLLPAAAGAPQGDGVLAGAPVQAIRFEHQTVLASLVPRALFDRENAANRTADPAWMAARVEAHHAVNVAATAAGACLPLTFGVLFSNLETLHQWLLPRASLLRNALAQAAAQTEWALSMREDTAAHAVWLDREDPILKRLADAVAAAGEGTAFLLARRLDKARLAVRYAHVGCAAATVATQLADAGFGVLDEPASAGPRRWTVLVPDRIASHRRNVLSDHVRVLASGLSRCGLSLHLSGPWPAYAFARAALAQEAVDG